MVVQLHVVQMNVCIFMLVDRQQHRIVSSQHAILLLATQDVISLDTHAWGLM
jgi:hypothetical protein